MVAIDQVIGVDPGTRQCGYAIFIGGEPVHCGLIRSNAPTVAARAADMGKWLAHKFTLHGGLVVVERPVIYPDSKERDSDQINLAVTAGVVGGALCAMFAGDLVAPEPRQWKGTTPKVIHNARTAARCPAAVELVNELPKGQRNHVWDAVGLALWGMERYGSK